jgi:hypothetical protein
MIANFLSFKIFTGKQYKATVFKYIAANCIADFLFLFTTFIYILAFNQLMEDGEMLYVVIVVLFILTRIFNQLSSFTSFTITIHRFHLLLKYRFVKRVNFKVIIASLVLVCLIVETPFFLVHFLNEYFKHPQTNNTALKEWFEDNKLKLIHALSLAKNSMTFLKCAVVLVLTFIMVIVLLQNEDTSKSNRKRVSSLSSSLNTSTRDFIQQQQVNESMEIFLNKRKATKNITKIIIFISILFLFNQIMNTFINRFFFSGEKSQRVNDVYLIYALLSCFFHSANVFIFKLFDSHFSNCFNNYCKLKCIK